MESIAGKGCTAFVALLQQLLRHWFALAWLLLTAHPATLRCSKCYMLVSRLDLREKMAMADALSEGAPLTEAIIPRQSLSERTAATASKLLAGHRGGPHTYLVFVGPAVIASIAYMDPGNFATNIQAGAKYGYGLLWVVLLANVVAMLFQALSAKLGIVTGSNLAEMCRDQFPAWCGGCGS